MKQWGWSTGLTCEATPTFLYLFTDIHITPLGLSFPFLSGPRDDLTKRDEEEWTMLRQIDKDDVSALLDGMTDRVTFAKAKIIFGLPQSVLSELLKDLEFFKLVDHDGQYYQTNCVNRAIWERYDRELDYMVFYKSDKAKRYHESHGINADVYDFEHTDLNTIEYMESDDDDCD